MYRAFWHTKLFCRLPDRGTIFNNVIPDLYGTLLDIWFQKTTPWILVDSLYAGGSRNMFIYTINNADYRQILLH